MTVLVLMTIGLQCEPTVQFLMNLLVILAVGLGRFGILTVSCIEP
jgi:hypothetical protein